MRKNKAKLQELRNSWKMDKSFEMLWMGEQVRFMWWAITGNPRYLWFIFQQSRLGKQARSAYDDARAKKKEDILWSLMLQGYYYHPGC